ncbi:MAG: PD40 domain-containing protein [Chloroflexi bacterium]|nr:PD40 domain-containing protein [Chloroflexota bacterium]
MNKQFLSWCGLLLILLACNMIPSASTPTIDLFATLSAATPLTGNPSAPANPAQTLIPFSNTQPTGQIVFTCQIYKTQASNQICIINADGTGFRRLTTENSVQHYYASLSPEGKSVVYSAFSELNIFEIYEMELATGNVAQLTDHLGILNGPEISPDGESIVFKFTRGASVINEIWIMDRNGQNVISIPGITGWDPTWSPDGNYILFASDMDGAIQLYTIRPNGQELHKVSDLPAIRGRSDWSPDGKYIVTYSGEAWKREVYILNADGSNAHVLSPVGGNSQGASFSPDSQWVTFTSYYDHPGDDHGCEIYILRIDGTDLRRLTDNDYCDYQPRWGP